MKLSLLRSKISLLRYRIQIGGAPWIIKTALGVARSAVKPGSVHRAAYDLKSQSPAALNILYIHSGWAIETVGRLWFSEQSIARVTFVRAGDILLTESYMKQFDFVWYGYWALYHQHPYLAERSVVAVHDPSELFTGKPNWQVDCGLSDKWVSHFTSFSKVVVISQEMKNVMTRLQVPTVRIPTTSDIPIRSCSDIPNHVSPKVLSVGRIYRRKNFELFKDVQQAATSAGLQSQFRMKCDHFPVSEEDYVNLLDDHPIYLCTSYQEGGPLPVMDAMRRGAVVVSTPVGQVPEIIEHGINGFICQNKDEMLNAIKSLERDPVLFRDMRLRSIRSICELRDRDVIANSVSDVLRDLRSSLES